MKVYITGPMTGVPNFNRVAFLKAEALLTNLGYQVVNPARLDGGDTTQSWLYYILRDLYFLSQCDAIYQLPNWKKSTGAMVEFLVAQKLGLKILKPKRRFFL